jgi:hypothetical protein
VETGQIADQRTAVAARMLESVSRSKTQELTSYIAESTKTSLQADRLSESQR